MPSFSMHPTMAPACFKMVSACPARLLKACATASISVSLDRARRSRESPAAASTARYFALRSAISATGDAAPIPVSLRQLACARIALAIDGKGST